MPELPLDRLNAFIVRAKAATYVGSGSKAPSCRPGSHDLRFEDGPFTYLDSYFGGSDFLGEEVVCFQDVPVWAMNYYGRILEPELISAAQAGQVIKASLSEMYTLGRFLTGFGRAVDGFTYTDTSEGDVTRFTGMEWICHGNSRVYELVYHGGLIKD
jgi:hypothetical protein